MSADTIFALSSGAGPAGIAVIRVAGSGTRAALQALCGEVPPPRTARLREIRLPSGGEAIDSGLILFFPAPHSFTGDDIAEFHLHGSLAVTRAVLDALAGMAGFRMARPGEFVQRAFERGKVDLIDVEALADLLAAETVDQARFARAYRTRLASAAREWRGILLDALAMTEAFIDFSDEGDVAANIDSETEQELASLETRLESAISGLSIGERMRRGFRVVVAGPPNSGKSSLLNWLAKRDVAIVSPIAGTTRDIVEVHLDLGGLPVILADTAGFRETEDVVEKIGVERARIAASEADLVLWLSERGQGPAPESRDWIIVNSKADQVDSEAIRKDENIWVSAETGFGMDRLIEMVRARSRSLDSGDQDVVVAHARQANELSLALQCLKRARVWGSDNLELRAEELRQVLRALDRLIGRVDYDEMLGRIFQRFCVGK